MIMSSSGAVCHGGELIAVGIEEFLHRLLSSHVMPFAIHLAGEIMEVTQVSCLSGIELIILG